MKSATAFSCALAALALFTVANAADMCTPMDAKDKAMYEDALGTDFMGCKLTMKEGMKVLSRMNYMTPAGGMPIVEMDTYADVDMSGMGSSKDVSMVKTGMKVAAASVGRLGAMTVSTECLLSLEPDFIASCIAKSKDAKEYNYHLYAQCKKMGTVRTINTSVRATMATQAAGEAVLCLLTSVLAIFFPILTGPLIASIKTIATTLFTVLPCPSVTPMAAP